MSEKAKKVGRRSLSKRRENLIKELWGMRLKSCISGVERSMMDSQLSLEH